MSGAEDTVSDGGRDRLDIIVYVYVYAYSCTGYASPRTPGAEVFTGGGDQALSGRRAAGLRGTRNVSRSMTGRRMTGRRRLPACLRVLVLESSSEKHDDDADE